jgi:hypothetical protein
MKTYGPVDELFANLTATQFSYEELMALVKEWVNGKQHYVFATDCVQGVTILAAQMCDLAWQGRAQCVSFGNVNKTTKFTGLIHLWAVAKRDLPHSRFSEITKGLGVNSIPVGQDLVCFAKAAEDVMLVLDAISSGEVWETNQLSHN